MLQTSLIFDYVATVSRQNSLKVKVDDDFITILKYRKYIRFLKTDLVLGILDQIFQKDIYVKILSR